MSTKINTNNSILHKLKAFTEGFSSAHRMKMGLIESFKFAIKVATYIPNKMSDPTTNTSAKETMEGLTTSHENIEKTKKDLATHLTSGKINEKELIEQIKILSKGPIEEEKKALQEKKEFGPEDRLKLIKNSLKGLNIKQINEKEYNQIEKALSELEEKYASERMDVLESIPTDDNGYPNAEELSKVNDIIEFLTSAENYVNHFRTIISDSFQNRLQTPNSDNGDGDVSITNQKNQDPISFLDQAKNLLDQAKKSRSTNFLDLEKSIKGYSSNQEKDFK